MPTTPETRGDTAADKARTQAKGCALFLGLCALAAAGLAWMAPGDHDPQPIGNGFHVMAIAPGTPAADPESRAAKACADSTRCTVLGFAEGTALPQSLPISDESAAALLFSFTKNGTAKSLWNCAAFPDAPKTDCLAR